MRVIALEKHFATREIRDAWKKVDLRWRALALKASTEGEGARRLLDFGPERLASMDEAGIDIAVLSLTTPGVQNLDADLAGALAANANDRLASTIYSNPERF